MTFTQIPWDARSILVSSSCSNPNFRVKSLISLEPDSWNEKALQAAWDESIPEEKRKIAIYSTSKIEAEREAWRWVENEKCSFELNTVLPCFTVSQDCLAGFQEPQVSFISPGWKNSSLRNIRLNNGVFAPTTWREHSCIFISRAYVQWILLKFHLITSHSFKPQIVLLAKITNISSRVVCWCWGRRKTMCHWPFGPWCQVSTYICVWRTDDLDRHSLSPTWTSAGEPQNSGSTCRWDKRLYGGIPSNEKSNLASWIFPPARLHPYQR